MVPDSRQAAGNSFGNARRNVRGGAYGQYASVAIPVAAPRRKPELSGDKYVMRLDAHGYATNQGRKSAEQRGTAEITNLNTDDCDQLVAAGF